MNGAEAAIVKTGGVMHKRLACYAALATLSWIVTGCSSARSNSANSAAGTPAETVAASAPSGSAKKAATIESAAFAQDSDGARLVLNADLPLLYTSYEPRPDMLVIDLTGTQTAPTFVTPAIEGSLVTSVKVEPQVELGRSQTRLTIMHRPALKFEIASQGKSLAIAFEEIVESVAENAPAPGDVTPQPAVVTAAEPASAPASSSASMTATPPEAAAKPVPSAIPDVSANLATGEVARSLEKVEISGSGSGATVVLLADGVLSASDFVLQNPPRIVLDLKGVRAALRQRTIAGTGPVLRSRISQFKSAPEKVVRVVLDLDHNHPYWTQRQGERLLIHVGETESVAAAAPRENESPSRTTIAAPAGSAAEPAPIAKPSEPAAPAVSPEPAPAPVAVAVAEEKPKTPAAPEDPFASVKTGAGVMSIPAGRRAPGVLEARRLPRRVAPAVEAPKPAAPRPKSKEDVLFESAEVLLAQQEKPADKQELSNIYKSKTVGGGESQYTGEPISLDLKDADIKDVFRTISELTGLNIVIDPDVRGTVTVRLENVPWDQALELVLKQNGLGYLLENNVMRIATTGKLQAEERDRAALDLARQSSLPTRTVTKKLSYASAGETAGTIKRVMSPRGDVIIDARTNTLIIREIADNMPTVLQLIESLDTPTPQVIIESRIVETTKTFGRTLGVNWGFTGSADAAHGNTTGLQFPNNGSVSGTVFTRPPGGQPSTTGLSLRLGNVLDTFNLDIALAAAENQGLVRIVSSPKVAAMTNQRASIQTGLQIPVQTTVNNTTSVVYVDATLQLSVTPQITAEGTVLLDVNITKRQPAPGVQIQGGGNVPLSIRQAQTKIIVKDGGTAVIGGIFQMSDNDSYNNVPGLWKIPIIGNLFRNTQKLDQHDELIIFITPRIIH
jgi:type IV pilus assembly protein PilQ